MAIAVNDAVTEILRPFPDAAVAGSGSYASIALEYRNKASRYLAFHLPIRWDSEDINLTAGTSEYAFAAETVARVWSVRYLRSANQDDNYRLKETDITRLDLEFGNWRGLENDEPQMFYIGATSAGALRLGVTPAPNLTTSGGYPILRCNVTRFGTLAAGGDLPANIRSSDVYVFTACWRYAQDFRRIDEAEYYKNLMMRAIDEERDFFFGRNAYDKQSIIYGAFPSGGIV